MLFIPSSSFTMDDNVTNGILMCSERFSGDHVMFEDIFPARLTHLRMQKGVSARDMSLSIGQNPGYINNIESGKALPSMSGFFYICEYLGVTPRDFFD